jgi:hypothetical protein
MNPSPRATGARHQRPLLFPAIDGRVEPWNGLTERQQRECRQALRHLLVAVACHLRDATDDQRRSLDQGPKDPSHD